MCCLKDGATSEEKELARHLFTDVPRGHFGDSKSPTPLTPFPPPPATEKKTIGPAYQSQ